MENTIFLFYISLISTVWVTWSVNAKRRAVWFDRLPNESLAGVPLVILRNEKYYPKLKEFYLNMFGRTNGENHVLKVRKQKVSAVHKMFKSYITLLSIQVIINQFDLFL